MQQPPQPSGNDYALQGQNQYGAIGTLQNAYYNPEASTAGVVQPAPPQHGYSTQQQYQEPAHQQQNYQQTLAPANSVPQMSDELASFLARGAQAAHEASNAQYQGPQPSRW